MPGGGAGLAGTAAAGSGYSRGGSKRRMGWRSGPPGCESARWAQGRCVARSRTLTPGRASRANAVIISRLRSVDSDPRPRCASRRERSAGRHLLVVAVAVPLAFNLIL
jgi:hypothetical protein